MENHYRLGVDIGGTFTDLLLLDPGTGESYLLKVPSTHSSVEAIAAGLAALRDRHHIALSQIAYFSHGTTLAVNTLVQRSGAKVGVLTTRGFRDVLELRRLRLPKANDFFVPRPISLVPRRYVKEVDERITADGQIYLPLRREDVAQRTRELVTDGIETLAICFLHSYRNPAHEILAKQWVEALHPRLYVCTSSELWPQQREYERSLVSVINAYVGGRMRSYLSALEEDTRTLGVACRVFATKSNGGVMNARSAAERPVETLLSGPASGVIGAVHLGRLLGDDRLVTFDMGGTSVDIAISQGDIPYSTENTVGDFPVILPAVDVVSIGAGGGSIAWTDTEGVLKVGPQSAGADPGPACYGRGSEAATVTDAYLVLGIVSPDNFLGGEMKLDPDTGRAAIERVGERLGLNPYQTADAILQVATSNIYAAILPQMARRGIDPRDFSIVAYGGAGPTHVFMLARDLNVRRIIVPPHPGLLCAMGCLVADVRADFVRTVWRECSLLRDGEVQEIYRALEEDARTWLEAERVDVERVSLVRAADMCYKGQSFEVTVPFPDSSPKLFTEHVVRWFHDRYEQVYGYVDRAAPVRFLEARVQIVGATPKPALQRVTTDLRAGVRPPTSRRLYDKGAFVDAAVYQRAALRKGDALEGPLIIEQYDTTTYVPAGFRVRVDEWFNVIGEAVN